MSVGNTQVFRSVCGLGRLVQYITTMVHRKKNKTKKIALCSMIIAVLCEEKEVTRRGWCKEWLEKRNERGSHATILQELRTGYESDFANYEYMRMDPNAFYEPFLFPLVIGNNVCPSNIIRPCGRTLIHRSFMGCSATTEPNSNSFVSV
ncbi:hypothetical protein E2C01_064595 [Portunus trituberculatus]|uniref:Uncharacterized protein n=1 Tax=Portunus trituberculatus TaxID=210409 RepID=A0A5B7HC93_PORTR|nr:hypothetical protein [Portunus trituberculatus]